jgi:hypothetical protein
VQQPAHSSKPAHNVANCIGDQWNRQYPNVSVVAYGTGLQVRTNAGPGLLMQAEVLPTVYGSWVSLSTYHHEMIVRGHPVIRVALACAE